MTDAEVTPGRAMMQKIMEQWREHYDVPCLVAAELIFIADFVAVQGKVTK